MAYSTGPYSLPTAIPAPDRPTLSDSRSIQFSTGTYETDAAGGFGTMPPVAQRVMLLVAYAGGVREPLIDERSLNVARDRVRKSLTTLTAGRSPLIRIESIEAVRTAPGTTRLHVSFVDLTSQRATTVQL